MNRTSQACRHMSSRAIRVSIVIPTFNAQERLLLLLKSLANQSVGNFEVIVVDDGSIDKTYESVQWVRRCFPVPLSYHYLDNTDIFGAGIARNYGAKRAKGNILLFIDQDGVAKKDLVQRHVDHHKTKDIILGYYAGYGNERNFYNFSNLRNCLQREKDIPVIKEFRDQFFKGLPAVEAWKYFVSAHFSIKKQLFKNFYFDEEFIQWGGQDVELGYRIVRAGKTINFEKDCIVYNSWRGGMHTKRKVRALLTSLIYTYKKHPSPEIRRYCLERFYHVPLKYRDELQLILKDSCFEIQKKKTTIVVDKDYNAKITLRPDFLSMINTIEEVIPMVRTIDLKIELFKTFDKSQQTALKPVLQYLMSVIRDRKIRLINH